MTGLATEPVVRRVRVATNREQRHAILGHEVVLPPSHKLPYYMERDPRYDIYAATVLERISHGHDSVLVIDVGANVGDTATIALSAASNISVRSVEGNPAFAAYAKRNLAPFGSRSEVIERFVGPIGNEALTYGDDGSTGGFGPAPTSKTDGDQASWITPSELLADASDHAVTVWKSDTDGFDIHLLVGHWSTIDTACNVIWFEYDPYETLGDVKDIEQLWKLLGASGRGLAIYDNLGNRMLNVEPGGPVESTLADLTNWLGEQREGHMEVAYLDVWAFQPSMWVPPERKAIEVRHT